MTEQLTPIGVLGVATSVLEKAGYSRVQGVEIAQGRLPNCRLFEDAYGVVLVSVWETWQALTTDWIVAQGALVEVMSEHIPSDDSKAWDGYLVLLLLGQAKVVDERAVDSLRGDTVHVRKLVAVGDDLTTIPDVERALAPLLPLDVDFIKKPPEGILDILPEALADTNTPVQTVSAVTAAFCEGRPLLEGLHKALWRNDAP